MMANPPARPPDSSGDTSGQREENPANTGGQAMPAAKGLVVKVRFLAVPPGALERTRMEVMVPLGTTVGDLIGMLAEDYPVLLSYTRFVSAAVNRAIVGMQTELQDGDEVIYSPPVGGG